jgi:hypothetical protein
MFAGTQRSFDSSRFGSLGVVLAAPIPSIFFLFAGQHRPALVPERNNGQILADFRYNASMDRSKLVPS